jgi:phosphomannomutase
MYTIKFGTDGWREIIAKDYTVENVRRVSAGTAQWIINTGATKVIVLGYDCRFGGEMFAKAAAEIFVSFGIKVMLADKMVSTPMISMAAQEYEAGLGVILTASHNPASYNGFKLKASFGGPALPSDVEAIEALIPETVNTYNEYEKALAEGFINISSFEDLYYNKVADAFDLDLLRANDTKFIYDAMYGAGQDVFKRILPNAMVLHGEMNPGFGGTAPEPIAKNLGEIMDVMKSGDYLCGLATDGDADRIGFFDGDGHFVDSHHLILLLMRYLVQDKGFSGKVVKSFSVSDKVQKLASHMGLETITTKIGFKYICGHMVNDDVLIGAEESGGIAIKGHIPERDGIWMGLALMEYCLKTGKTVKELINEVYAITGSFAVERYDLHLNEAKKLAIVESCKKAVYKSFGKYTIESIEDTDGFKFRLTDGSWVMIRPSGTEPVLRVYSEAANSEAAFAILNATKETILA